MTKATTPLPFVSKAATDQTHDKRVLCSFLTAWICQIASRRELLPISAFRNVSFNGSTVSALRRPTDDRSTLDHRGLYHWLRDDIPRLVQLRSEQKGIMIISFVVKKDGEVLEVYEMRCVEGGEGDMESLRGGVTCVLRATDVFLMTMAGLGKGFGVEVGMGEVQTNETFGRVGLGCVRMEGWQIQCSLRMAERS
eukprot:GFKZ01008751.1.p2 GENE.GFKZ01008751.1~~GFKZ01008751.1.p2  ORF type:complete len:195 (-),score=19.75 GFKZ01008751.1:878-1462(-)